MMLVSKLKIPFASEPEKFSVCDHRDVAELTVTHVRALLKDESDIEVRTERDAAGDVLIVLERT